MTIISVRSAEEILVQRVGGIGKNKRWSTRALGVIKKIERWPTFQTLDNNSHNLCNMIWFRSKFATYNISQLAFWPVVSSDIFIISLFIT